MIKIIWLNFLSYIVIDKTAGKEPKAFPAANKTILARVLNQLQVPREEYLTAIQQMEENGHNISEFGVIRKSFVFSDYDHKYDKFRKFFKRYAA